MGRPSKHTDRQLLKAGRKMIAQTGLSGLSLRRVAAKAGVNLGMFHYYFKSKEAFLRRILDEIYEDFFRGFRLETSGSDSPLHRLRRALMALGRFSREQRDLVPVLAHDVLEGHSEIVRFARTNVPRHLRIIITLIRQCQKQGLLRRLPLPLAVSFLAGSVAAPQIVIGLVERAKIGVPLKIPLFLFRNGIISDRAIAARVEMALKGMAPL